MAKVKDKELSHKEVIILQILDGVRDSLDDIEDTIKNYDTDAYDIEQALIIIRKVWNDAELVSDMVWL